MKQDFDRGQVINRVGNIADFGHKRGTGLESEPHTPTPGEFSLFLVKFRQRIDNNSFASEERIRKNQDANELSKDTQFETI